MYPSPRINQLKKYTIQILECESDFLRMKKSVVQVYQMFSEISGIDMSGHTEKISIDAALTNPQKEKDRLFYYESEKPPFACVSLRNGFVKKPLQYSLLNFPNY